MFDIDVDRALLRRFFDKVLMTDGCWEWQAAKRNGYGALKIGRELISAHRLSYFMFRGEIPSAMCVLHHCDNRVCVRPDHLFLGTHSDNVKDMDAKDRRNATTGEQHRGSVLTAEVVVAIRHLRESKGWGKRRIARQLGVNSSTVGSVLRQLSWKKTGAC